MGANMTNAQLHGCAVDGWECFHCGELFTTVGAARDHFGATPDATPGCLLKIQFGDERGWLMELRRLETEVATLRHERMAEETEADKKIRSWHGRLQTEVRTAEEAGFNKATIECADLIAHLEAEVKRLRERQLPSGWSIISATGTPAYPLHGGLQSPDGSLVICGEDKPSSHEIMLGQFCEDYLTEQKVREMNHESR